MTDKLKIETRDLEVGSSATSRIDGNNRASLIMNEPFTFCIVLTDYATSHDALTQFPDDPRIVFSSPQPHGACWCARTWERKAKSFAKFFALCCLFQCLWKRIWRHTRQIQSINYRVISGRASPASSSDKAHRSQLTLFVFSRFRYLRIYSCVNLSFSAANGNTGDSFARFGVINGFVLFREWFQSCSVSGLDYSVVTSIVGIPRSNKTRSDVWVMIMRN